MMLGLGLQINKLKIKTKKRPVFFVRPAGQTYGNSDGTSYENAWSGANEFETNQVENSIVYLAGTFSRETFSVEVNNLTLRGDYNGDSGVIDGEDATGLGITMDDIIGVKIYNLGIINNVSANIEINGDCEIQTFNIDISGSSDQGIQHFGNTVAVHNDITGYDCVDEAISGHEEAHITLNRGVLGRSNSGINAVGNGTIIVNDTQFDNNTSYDLNIPNNGLSCTANNVTFTQKNRCDKGANLTLNNCDGNQNIELGNTVGGNLIINNSLIGEIIGAGSLANSESECIINNSVCSIRGRFKNGIEINDSKITITNLVEGGMILKRNLLISTGTSDHAFEVESVFNVVATYNVCILSDSNDWFFNLLNTNNIIDNNTFIGKNGNGRAIIKSSAGSNIYNNNIFLDLERDIQSSNAANTLNNCVRFNITSLGGSNITSNNEVTTNPDLENVSNNNFALKVGSPAIGAGVVVSNTLGIDSANWTGALPSVVSKTQVSPFDIGAYIS